MLILHSENLIIDDDKIKIVPITDTLNNIDNVRTIVRKVIKDKDNNGKILTICNYLFNDDKKQVVIGSSKINNVRCPYRDLSRKI